MTYPDHQVVQTLNTEFAPVRLNIAGAEREVAQYEVGWTPAVFVLDARGVVYYRFDGFLPPDEYVPMALLGKALVPFRQRRYDLARDIYTRVLDVYPESRFRPEILFHLFIARIWTGDRSGGQAARSELKTKYGNSLWALRLPD